MVKTRNDIVDAFRAVAVVGVLLFHYFNRWPSLYHYTQMYPRLFALGRYGVYVFFVISGLVISMTLLRSRSALEFGLRRFARLYPAYFLFCTLTFLVMIWVGPTEFKVHLVDYIANLLLVAKDLKLEMVDGSYWTLVVEAKFYFIAAVAYMALGQRFWLAVLGVFIVAAVGVLRGLLLFKYMPFFLAGIGLYFGLYRHRPISWPNFKLGPVAYLGRVSYSLYLVHQFIGVTIIWAIKTQTHAPDYVAYCAAIVLCTALACFSYHFIEIPAQRYILSTLGRNRSNSGLTVAY